MKSPKILYAWVLLVFASSEVLAHLLGVRFAAETLSNLYQYLDPEILRDDLARGLWYLHAQPPLFNLFLGVVLKIFPDSYEAAFSFVFGAMGLSLLWAMAYLMRRLGVHDVWNGAFLLVFAMSPNFPVYRHWLFYTLPVALLLTLAAVALERYAAVGRRLPLAAFFGAVTALMMTRSVFHPLWLVVVVAAVTPFLPRARRRAFGIGALVPLVVTLGWFAKNAAVVSSFTGSSWLGMSLSKRWPLSQSEVESLKQSGILPPFWHRRSFLEPSELVPFGFFGDGENVHPALDSPYKSNGEPNFNHRDYVVVSDRMLRGDLRLITRYPGRYLKRVGTALLLFLQPGPNSVDFLVDYDFESVHRYRDWLTRYVFWGGSISRPIRMGDPPANAMLLVFPLLLGVATAVLVRGPAEHRALVSFMLLSVLFVTAVTSFIEIGENDRMRWEVEPFLVIFAGLAARGLLARRLKGP